MAAEFILLMDNLHLTSGVLRKKVLEYHRALSGAAQNLDLFPHSRPSFAEFVQPEGEQEVEDIFLKL